MVLETGYARSTGSAAGDRGSLDITPEKVGTETWSRELQGRERNDRDLGIRTSFPVLNTSKSIGSLIHIRICQIFRLHSSPVLGTLIYS